MGITVGSGGEVPERKGMRHNNNNNNNNKSVIINKKDAC
jgi:hypothetical protein